MLFKRHLWRQQLGQESCSSVLHLLWRIKGILMQHGTCFTSCS